MKIRFTKLTPTEHRFEIERTDGSRESVVLETRSFMPHDLIHLAYESEAGLHESFFGKLASGTTLAEFNDRELMSNPTLASTEMVMTERITGPLTAYLAGGVSAEAFLGNMHNMFDALGAIMPPHLTVPFLEGLAERYRRLSGQWKSLPHHTQMEVPWS